MKKKKMISSFSSNGSFNELFFRPNNKINYNPNIISLNKNKGRNKFRSQNESYDLKKKTNQSSHSKNHSLNKKNNNSNLSSLKYIRSLKFYLNNHIAAINTRYSNHNSNDKQINKNNHTYYFVNNDRNNFSSKYAKDSLKIEEKKDNNPKFLLCNSVNSVSKLYSPNKSNYNSKNQTYRNKLLMSKKNSFDRTYDKANELRKDKTIKKIIKLQAYFRGHMLRSKLVNSLVRYSKYIKFFDIIQKIIIPHKKQFFNNIKNLKQKNSNNTNKLRSKNKNNNNNRSNNKSINNINNNNNNIYDINNNLKNNIKNYTICHLNNFNIKNTKNSNNNIKINPQLKKKSFIICDKNSFNINGNRKITKKEKTNNTKDLNKLVEEKIKEFQKQNEEKYNKLKNDYDSLNNKYIDIIKQNEQLLKEINSLKEKNEKVQKNKSLSEFKITQEIKFDIIGKDNDTLTLDMASEKTKTIQSVNSDKLSIYTVNEVDEDDKNSKDKNENRKVSIKDKTDNNNSIRKSTKSCKVKTDNNKNEEIQKSYRKSVKINITKTNEQLQNYIIEKNKKEQSIKNLIKIKNYKIKDFLRKNFAKFYYNGIFLKMTGRLQHLNSEEIEQKKQEKQEKIKIINADSNLQKSLNNGFRRRTMSESKISFHFDEKEEDKIEREKTQTAKDEFLKRLKKSRGLRKLMSKRAIEKKELLRIYFFKFYRAGIVSQFRKIKRRKTCQFQMPMSLELSNKILEDSQKDKNKEKGKELEDESIAKEKKEKEELKKKTIKILERIIFKEDRRHKILLKNVFQRFYLKIKLDSVKNVLDSDKGHNKKKKKRFKKKKTTAMKEDEKKDEENKNNEDDVNENINN